MSGDENPATMVDFSTEDGKVEQVLLARVTYLTGCVVLEEKEPLCAYRRLQSSESSIVRLSKEGRCQCAAGVVKCPSIQLFFK